MAKCRHANKYKLAVMKTNVSVDLLAHTIVNGEGNSDMYSNGKVLEDQLKIVRCNIAKLRRSTLRKPSLNFVLQVNLHKANLGKYLNLQPKVVINKLSPNSTRDMSSKSGDVRYSRSRRCKITNVKK